MTWKTVKVHLQLCHAASGGSATPLQSAYRSLVRLEGSEVDFGIELQLDAEAPLAPGESGTARMSFWAVEALPSGLSGRAFELREGTRVVGEGTILEA